MSFSVGIQLFQLQDEMKRDFDGVMDALAELGVMGVELHESLDLSRIGDACKARGIEIIGTHVSMESLQNNLDGLIDEQLKLGGKYVTCAYHAFHSMDDIERNAQFYNRVGEIIAENGMIFCYHNHFKEFTTIDGRYALDLLFEHTNQQYVKAELDVYFMKEMGIDPVQYIRPYKNRCPLLHAKDIRRTGAENEVVALGTGELDLQNVLQAADDIGTEWIIIELSKAALKHNPLGLIETSIQNFKNTVGG
ncbi:sugar phosphate isomerase/epimerase [Paenibacillus sp. J5C_2022]|uniref:sugar phosphate isomerase/epimerase family protein n=1 Tax=Paenibacillus sp. J5C2022 TaxID=2977129 RepID=UPI0021D09BD3|nr:sugar phosphate isomerase/epimerase [Paenibacillus sp. J5C2022]MCU6710743.1 sugar phosphate isomerase/epimerase [Paenibacillus sp. J5C2022]